MAKPKNVGKEAQPAPAVSQEKTAGSIAGKASNPAIRIMLIAAIAVVAIGVINIFSLSNVLPAGKEPTGAATGVQDSAIDATIIYASACNKCFNASAVVDAVEQLGAKISVTDTLDVSSSKAASLAKKYNITRVPTIIFSGDIEKNPQVSAAIHSIGENTTDGKVVLTKVPPPYYELVSKEVKGIVDVTYINDTSCTECHDSLDDIGELEGYGVVFGKKSVLDYNGAEAKELIAKYKIRSVPAVMFSGDVSEYGNLMSALNSVGTFESDGTYVLRSARPPYRNLTAGKIEGVVDITYLADASCKECYNVTMHRDIIQKFGARIGKETTLDVSAPDGSTLVAKYNITAVPTIVLSRDAAAYPSIMQVWPSVGTIEPDGTFVFRNIAAASDEWVYRNLTSGKVVGLTNSTK